MKRGVENLLVVVVVVIFVAWPCCCLWWWPSSWFDCLAGLEQGCVVIGEWGMSVRMQRPKVKKKKAMTTSTNVNHQKDFDKDATEDGVPSWMAKLHSRSHTKPATARLLGSETARCIIGQHRRTQATHVIGSKMAQRHKLPLGQEWLKEKQSHLLTLEGFALKIHGDDRMAQITYFQFNRAKFVCAFLSPAKETKQFKV